MAHALYEVTEKAISLAHRSSGSLKSKLVTAGN